MAQNFNKSNAVIKSRAVPTGQQETGGGEGEGDPKAGGALQQGLSGGNESLSRFFEALVV